jgi:hypothetical protein
MADDRDRYGRFVAAFRDLSILMKWLIVRSSTRC